MSLPSCPLLPPSFSLSLTPPNFSSFPPSPKLLTEDRRGSLGQSRANISYFLFYQACIYFNGHQRKTPQAISTSKCYFMGITAQGEANWKMARLKGTGSDTYGGWVVGDRSRGLGGTLETSAKALGQSCTSVSFSFLLCHMGPWAACSGGKGCMCGGWSADRTRPEAAQRQQQQQQQHSLAALVRSLMASFEDEIWSSVLILCKALTSSPTRDPFAPHTLGAGFTCHLRG